MIRALMRVEKLLALSARKAFFRQSHSCVRAYTIENNDQVEVKANIHGLGPGLQVQPHFAQLHVTQKSYAKLRQGVILEIFDFNTMKMTL